MSELSELQAYKQLLQVTQNILNELSPQQQILRKYLTLKKSILSKTRPSAHTHTAHPKLISAYKSITKNILECLTQFETEIEGQMSKQGFMKNTNRIIKDMEKECRILSEDISDGAGKSAKLMLKEEINGVKFLCKQIAGKVENMGLMIQVHRKMHEIILQASQKQAKTAQKQNQYNRRLGQMEGVVDQVSDIRKFIQSYQLTDRKMRKFELARKNLAKVLFNL